jgi:hypothetical protein
MNWMAWAALGCFGVGLIGFVRGAFALSWDGLPWMFLWAVASIAGLVFGVCWVFA